MAFTHTYTYIKGKEVVEETKSISASTVPVVAWSRLPGAAYRNARFSRSGWVKAARKMKKPAREAKLISKISGGTLSAGAEEKLSHPNPYPSMAQTTRRPKMRLFLVVAAILTLTACATLNPPAATPSAQDDAVTVRLPKWPYVAYSTEAQDAYVVLSIKDPKTFPIPKILTFTRQDGSKVEMKLMVKPEK